MSDILTVSWEEIKSFVATREARLQYVAFPSYYHIRVFDGAFSLETRVDRSPTDTTELDDFETNFLPTANARLDEPFAKDGGFKAAHTGFTGTATKNTTTDIDFKLVATRYITGIQLIIDDSVFGDKATFQIVDKDNILGYGAGVVLNEFGSSWNINPDSKNQGQVVHNFYATIYVNLYIRVKYVSEGTILDPKVAVNLFMYRKT